MSRIKSIKKQTDNKFLNLYELEAERRDGSVIPYYVASRAPSVEKMKLYTKQKKADAVQICAVVGELIVLEKQFRYAIDDYVYELPAGLIEEGETLERAAEREFYEETGMTFMPVRGHNSSRPYYSSVGLTDESIATIYGYGAGIPSSENEEASEDIQVIMADRRECIRILREENVSTMAAYMMMNFVNSPGDPFAWLV